MPPILFSGHTIQASKITGIVDISALYYNIRRESDVRSIETLIVPQYFLKEGVLN